MGRAAAERPGGAVGLKADDLYSWALRQSEFLRARRLGEIDAEGLAEEIDDVREEQYLRLESALRVLLHHLLKWDFQPGERSRSWTLTVREQRRRVERQLRKNPALRTRLDEAYADAFEDARDDAARETGLPLRAFPEAPPFSFTESMERQIAWPGDED